MTMTTMTIIIIEMMTTMIRVEIATTMVTVEMAMTTRMMMTEGSL